MKTSTGRPRRWGRWFLRLVVFALALAILYQAWGLFSRRGSAAAAGTYLMAGGQSYIAIDRAPGGRLRVTETGGIATHPFMRTDRSAWTARFEHGRLVLTQVERFVPSPPSMGFSATLGLTLEPSAWAPGDWNAVEGYSAIGPGPAVLGQLMETASPQGKRETARALWAWAKSLFAFRGMATSRLDATTPPFRSFLHRVDDPRVVEYFRDRFSGDPTTATLTLIRALAADRPADPYLALHRIDAETAVGDPIEAASLFGQWEKDNAATPDALLAESAKRVRTAIVQLENKKSKPGLLSLAEAFPLPDAPTADSTRVAPSLKDLNALLNWLRDLTQTPGLLAAEADVGLVVPARRTDAAAPDVQIPSFIGMQVMVKVARVAGTLYLLEGRCDEALALFAGSYRFGQSLNASGILIQRLIGIAIRAIAAEGLRIYALDACETPRDLEECWAMLERLDKTPGQGARETLFAGERSPVVALMRPVGPLSPNFLEAEIRHDVADMKFQVVRMAAAARHRFLSAGRFPQSRDEFGLFGAEGFPADAFASSAPLRFVQPEQGEFTVYSVGPDRDDDHGAVVYDSSNGSTSDGDIFAAVPREREFPFRREGVRAADADDLLGQFPNGFPMDPFSPVRNRPLSVLDSTATQPLVVFSFGPDSDGPYWREPLEESAAPVAPPDALGPPGVPPPGPQPVSLPESTPGSRAEESPGRRMQLVFDRTNRDVPEFHYDMKTPPPPPGTRPKWHLQSPYDPTNGATSRGDIFVEIPKGRQPADAPTEALRP